MTPMALRLSGFSTVFLILFFSCAASGQEAPPFMPSLLEADQGTNSLLNLLRADLMRKYQDAQKPQAARKSASQIRPARPRPELGPRKPDELEPEDLSQYFGPETGDTKSPVKSPVKSPKPAPEVSKIPMPASPPATRSVTSPESDLWTHVPLEKRIAFARDLFKRRKFDEARKELEAILAQRGKKEDNLELITLREKCLFHQREYPTVESDYYRLKNFYPARKELAELKQYLGRESGLNDLEQRVWRNPADPQAQRALLDRYLQYGWLDFAEEFFLTLQDTSPVTVKSLSEVYYKKGDQEMLINLSRKAYSLHPEEIEFLYNEAVGLYNLGDAVSRKQAREKFEKAAAAAGNTRLRGNAEWYLRRLAPPTR
ncbi:MAG: hypothetical protein ACE15F_11690 [bacterium]